MDNKKFEQLIDLIINEDEEKARALFHDIVVEKSREIYESIMDEEMMGSMGMEEDMDEGMGGQVGDLLDEINAEEVSEDDEEADMMDLDDEEVVDITANEVGAEDEFEEIEDTVNRIEDKLDQLMAEFEAKMGEGDDEDKDFGDMPDTADEEGEEGEEDEEEVMEAITLKKVSVTHGDNGANTKSPTLHDPKVKAAGVNPVKFSGASESVPTGPKGPSNAYSKGETQVKGAGSFKNAPAQAGQNLEAAPKPKHGDDGANTKSPLGESKKVVKKIVK